MQHCPICQRKLPPSPDQPAHCLFCGWSEDNSSIPAAKASSAKAKISTSVEDIARQEIAKGDFSTPQLILAALALLGLLAFGISLLFPGAPKTQAEPSPSVLQDASAAPSPEGLPLISATPSPEASSSAPAPTPSPAGETPLPSASALGEAASASPLQQDANQASPLPLISGSPVPQPLGTANQANVLPLSQASASLAPPSLPSVPSTPGTFSTPNTPATPLSPSLPGLPSPG